MPDCVLQAPVNRVSKDRVSTDRNALTIYLVRSSSSTVGIVVSWVGLCLYHTRSESRVSVWANSSPPLTARQPDSLDRMDSPSKTTVDCRTVFARIYLSSVVSRCFTMPLLYICRVRCVRYRLPWPRCVDWRFWRFVAYLPYLCRPIQPDPSDQLSTP